MREPSSQGDPADEEGRALGTAGGRALVRSAPQAPGPAAALCLLGPPTLSRLNIGLAAGPAPRPRPLRRIIIAAPFIESLEGAKHTAHPHNDPARWVPRRTGKFREVKQQAQGHPAWKWHGFGILGGDSGKPPAGQP